MREEVLLQHHIVEATGRKGSASSPILSVTNSDGFVQSLDVFDKQVFSADTSRYKLVRFNELAYNPSRINVGSVALCELPEGGAVSPMYVVVRCRDTLLPKYLYYFLKSPIGAQHINYRSIGAVRSQLRFSDLAEIAILLPAIPDQERIVGVIDEISRMRELRLRSMRRTSKMPMAIFQDVLRHTPIAPDTWPRKTLREVLARPLQNGLSPSADGAYPDEVLTLSAVTGPDFNPESVKQALFSRAPEPEKRVREEQFLICRGSGAIDLVGTGKFATEPAFGKVYPDTIIAAEFDKSQVLPEFIEIVWTTPQIRSQIRARARTTSGTFKINQASLESVSFLMPPMEVQTILAERIGTLRALRSVQANSNSRIDSLFAAATERAFRGAL